MPTLTWLAEAHDDLKRLHDFIEPHSPSAAARAINTLIEAAESLQNFQEKGRGWDLDAYFREISVKFGARSYVIRYRLLENQVIIIRVWHALENL